jgi:hypothetical protein
MKQGRRSPLAPLLAALALSAALAPVSAHAEEPKPEEYRPEEFAAWMHKLRRGEVILVGSLPFSVFVVTLAYDTVRYFVHVNEMDARRYAPWPFRPPDAEEYTPGENIGVAVGVLACSLAVSVADYIIGEIRERRAASP